MPGKRISIKIKRKKLIKILKIKVKKNLKNKDNLNRVKFQ